MTDQKRLHPFLTFTLLIFLFDDFYQIVGEISYNDGMGDESISLANEYNSPAEIRYESSSNSNDNSDTSSSAETFSYGDLNKGNSCLLVNKYVLRQP